MTVEIACKDAVFHFNKHHLVDPATPMWVIKTGGKTYYVNHVDCKMGWSTKETPNNSHTKGAIKLTRALLTINDDNEAELRPLTSDDIARVKSRKGTYARILVHNQKGEIKEFLERNLMLHGKIQKISGGCGTSFDLIGIKKKEDLVMLALAFHGCYRVLQPNELYYKAYDNPDILSTMSDDDDEID
jgi:hypothetical protein